MRFNAIILVIIGLVAFVSTKKPAKDDTHYFDVYIQRCVEECGRDPHCHHYCDCLLHKMPDVVCRNDDCQRLPQDCDRYDQKRSDDQAAPEPAPQVHPENIDYNKDALVSNNGTVMGGDAGGGTCLTQGCDIGLPYCLEQCGSGPQCEGYCACYLHSNPKSACRRQGCVEAPQGCDRWEFSERDKALASPKTADFDRVAVAAVAQEASPDDDDEAESPPIDHCQFCRAAGYECSQNCHGDQACKESCLCPNTERNSCFKCKSFGCPRS